MIDKTKNDDKMETEKISRNAPCPCGSGKKYKLCCGAKVVAAERAEAAQRSRFWVPDGVTAETDDQPDDWICDRPRWRRSYKIEDDTDVDEAMTVLYDNFVCAYSKKYCVAYDFEEEVCPNGVMLLQFYTRSNRPLASGPISFFGNCENMWDLLRRRMESFLECCRSGEYVCVVRWDSRSGGPILSLKCDMEETVWMFTRPGTLDDNEFDEDELDDEDDESEELEGDE